jgi:hypothetical protein
MEEQANNVVGGPEGAPKKNAGWFQRGDGRINRDGRPKKVWADCADRAPFAGRLMLLRMPRGDFLRRLADDGAPRIANLPPDCEIVASRADVGRDAVTLTIHSASFPRIPKGAPLVEFVPEAAPPADCAPCDDSLMLLFVPEGQLAHRLAHPRSFILLNMPHPVEIVASRVDPARKGVLFTLRSGSFRPVPKGAPIPEFKAQCQGLAIAKMAGWDRGPSGL